MSEIVDWLLNQIATTTNMERLDMIRDTIASDKQNKADYLDAESIVRLRTAWMKKRKELEIENANASSATT